MLKRENLRLGLIGIFIHDLNNTKKVNKLLNEYAEFIRGRFGVPLKNKQTGVISLIFEGSTDIIGALTGKLGQIKGVEVKTLLSKEEINE